MWAPRLPLSGRPRWAPALPVLALALAWSGPAAAQPEGGQGEAGQPWRLQSSSWLGLGDPAAGAQGAGAPMVQWLTLSRSWRDPGLGQATLVMSAWGRLDPLDLGGAGLGADLDLFYVEAQAATQPLRLRVGRQLIVGGAARLRQIDGLWLSWRPGVGLGAQLYAGTPTRGRFGTAWGDAVAGGRLAYAFGFEHEVGVSYLLSAKGGRVSAQDLGLDLHLRPLRPLSLSARSTLALGADDLKEGALRLGWQLSPSLRVDAYSELVRPDLFLDQGSIFSVFSDGARVEGGSALAWRAARGLEVGGAFSQLLEASGGRDGLRGRLTLRHTLWRGALRLGLDLDALGLRAAGAQPEEGYAGGRVFGRLRLGERGLLWASAAHYQLAAPVNGAPSSTVLQLGGAWAVGEGLTLNLTGRYAQTPTYLHQATLMARLDWRFDAASARAPVAVSDEEEE